MSQPQVRRIDINFLSTKQDRIIALLLLGYSAKVNNAFRTRDDN
jgi:hypothetical protein